MCLFNDGAVAFGHVITRVTVIKLRTASRMLPNNRKELISLPVSLAAYTSHKLHKQIQLTYAL